MLAGHLSALPFTHPICSSFLACSCSFCCGQLILQSGFYAATVVAVASTYRSTVGYTAPKYGAFLLLLALCAG